MMITPFDIPPRPAAESASVVPLTAEAHPVPDFAAMHEEFSQTDDLGLIRGVANAMWMTAAVVLLVVVLAQGIALAADALGIW